MVCELRPPKMYPHTEFGIPTLNDKGDMHWTWCETDARQTVDGRYDYYMPQKVPLGHKKQKVMC